jgi:pimeloyl-ACP methyl ester carboxylesterase
MYYEDDDYTDPWRTPETIVLHHGNGKNARLWYAWVPLLARQYRVIRVDARGFGRSSVPPKGYDWSLSNFGTDLLNLMDHLEVDKFHLVGETIGGTISLQLAHDHPERLHTVTTCTSPYNFVGVGHYLDYYRTIETEGVEAWVRQSANRRLVPGKSNPEHHEWYAQQMMQSSGQVVMELLSYLSTVDLTPILPQVKTPALILVAQNSDTNTPDRADSLAELLPNSTLVKIPDASGYVQHSEPEKCVEHWREFIGHLSHQRS